MLPITPSSYVAGNAGLEPATYQLWSHEQELHLHCLIIVSELYYKSATNYTIVTQPVALPLS